MNIGIDTEKARKTLKEHLKKQRMGLEECIDNETVRISKLEYNQLLSDSIMKDYYYRLLMDLMSKAEIKECGNETRNHDDR